MARVRVMFVGFALFFGLIVVAPHAAAAPSNDNFAGARTVGELPYENMAPDTWYATTEPGEPGACYPGASRTVWWKYTPAADVDLIADTQVSGVDTQLAVYTGTSLAGLTRVACMNGYGYNQPRIALRVTAGTTYYFQVSSYGGWSWFVNLYLVTQRPPNDDFAAATRVSALPFATTQNTLGQTHEHGDRGCYDSSWWGRGVWFDYTAGDYGELIADTVGSSYRSIVSVFTGDALGSLSLVGCSGYSESLPASFAWQSAPGVTYRMHVHNNSRQTGNLAFRLRMVPPRNDAIATAFTLADQIPARVGQGTALATVEPGEPRPCGDIGSTVWWRYVSAENRSLLADTFGSTYDTVLAVYTGSSLGNLTPIACGEQSRLAVNVQAGKTYYFQVGGRSGATGRYVLNVARVETVPYTGFVAGASIRCPDDPPQLVDTRLGVGGVCLTAPSPGVADLLVRDDSFDPVAARYEFRGRRYYGGGEGILGSGTFCAKISELAIPSGTTRLVVALGAGATTKNCPAHAATTGTVTATFRR